MNPKIEYEDCSHKNLGLAISEKDLDVSNLAIISSKELPDIEFGVLGASHYVKVRNGNDIITEVFACRKLEGDMEYHSLNDLVRGDGKPITHENESFSYDFQSTLISDEEAITLYMIHFEVMGKDVTSNNLKEIFPTQEEPAFEACTHINVREYENIVLIETLHTYPEEHVIIYTQTKITKK